MRRTPAIGLTLSGLGVALLAPILERADVELSVTTVRAVVVLGGLLFLGGIAVVLPSARRDPSQVPDSRRRADLLLGPMPADRGLAEPLRRAIADTETELDAIKARVIDAQRRGAYPMNFHLPANHYQAISDALADRDLAEARQAVSDVYNAADALNHRVRGRDLVGGVFIREPTIPMAETDGTDEIVRLAEKAKAQLNGVPK